MEVSPIFVTLMGMGTVFFGLICIIFLTMIMGSVLKSSAKPAAPAAKAPAAAPAAPAAPKVDTAKEQEVIAVIVAAMTQEFGPSAARMQITDIKKI